MGVLVKKKTEEANENLKKQIGDLGNLLYSINSSSKFEGKPNNLDEQKEILAVEEEKDNESIFSEKKEEVEKQSIPEKTIISTSSEETKQKETESTILTIGDENFKKKSEKKETKSKRLNLLLTKTLFEHLREYSKIKETSVNDLINILLEKEVEEWKKNQA